MKTDMRRLTKWDRYFTERQHIALRCYGRLISATCQQKLFSLSCMQEISKVVAPHSWDSFSSKFSWKSEERGRLTGISS